MQAGKSEVESVPFDVGECIQRATSVVTNHALFKGVAFIVGLDPDLPARVLGDPSRLRQVLFSLLMNAIKSTDQGQVTVCVTVAEEKAQEATVRFEVRDTGTGISDEQIGHIFEPAPEVEAAPVKASGTGLGLRIIRKMIELMGGQIGVASTIGRGSCVYFDIPFKLAVERRKAEGSSQGEA
jgi:signal transduction histidine kinase